jgi:hypothetical protein
MLAKVTMSEGEWWVAVETTYLDMLEAMDTGKLSTEYAGVIEPAAMAFDLESCIIYDFILKKMGHCPVRYWPNYATKKMLWA